MKRSKRTVTAIETHSVTVIKSSGGAQRWCANCGAQVWMASIEQAAVLTSISARTIYRWVETGKVHFSETTTGPLRVCLHSLLKRTKPALAPALWTDTGDEEDQVIIQNGIIG